jgi:hypothetical protein
MPKGGSKPHGPAAMDGAERIRLYRARKHANEKPLQIWAPGDFSPALLPLLRTVALLLHKGGEKSEGLKKILEEENNC